MAQLVQLGLIAVLAGFIGTVIMTIAQWIEMAITKRESSTAPGQVFCKVFRINFRTLSDKRKTQLTYLVHFLYGTLWGLLLVLLTVLNVENTMMLILLYFVIVWVQGLVVYTLFDIAPWFWTWGLVPNLKEIFFKILLSGATVGSYIYLQGVMGFVP